MKLTLCDMNGSLFLRQFNRVVLKQLRFLHTKRSIMSGGAATVGVSKELTVDQKKFLIKRNLEVKKQKLLHVADLFGCRK